MNTVNLPAELTVEGSTDWSLQDDILVVTAANGCPSVNIKQYPQLVALQVIEQYETYSVGLCSTLMVPLAIVIVTDHLYRRTIMLEYKVSMQLV